MIGIEKRILLDNDVQAAIAGLIGKGCCRQRLGGMRSLHVGFGEKIPHGRSRLVDHYYGEWEIGTYSAAWRVIRNGEILCGSQDVVDSLDELEKRFRKIQLGRIQAIYMISKFDIRVELDEEVFIDFIGASVGDEELFHIFCPTGVYVEYSVVDGWKLGNAGRRVEYSDEKYPRWVSE